MKNKNFLWSGILLVFPILFFCTTVDFDDIDDLVNGPDIIIPEPNPDTITVGEVWELPEVIALDNIDGNITNSVEHTGTVDNTKEGMYEIIFTVKNSKNVESKDTLIIFVIDNGVKDTEAPVIEIPDPNPVTIWVDESFSIPTATAIDNVDGSVSVSHSGSVNNTSAGVYKITYTATDAAGNTGTADLTVIVKADTEAPVITIPGDNPDTVNLNGNYTTPTATATDNKDNNVTVTHNGSVNTAVANSYTIIFSATDAAGNNATKDLIVVVLDDTTTIDNEAPVITIPGVNPVKIKVGENYTIPTATATDNVDQNVSVSHSGTVDNTKVGEYIITYTATDAAGNTATKTLTFIVEEDIVVPGDSLLIEDFESGEKSQISLWNNDNDGWWYGYVGGTSTIEPETTDSINMDEKVADSAANSGSLGMYAKITLNGGSYPSAMVGFSLKTSETYYDLSQLDSITLYMKGSGTINVHLATKYVNTLPVNDAWGHYGKDVSLEGVWTKIVIKKDDLKASPHNPAITKSWSDASNEVTSMGFEVTGAENETGGTVVEVYIDDIYFYGISEIK